jgi:hypothetical protein
LAAIFVAFTASLGAGDSIWNSRSAKWLALMIVFVLAMGVVTFYYTIQLESQPPDEQDGSSAQLVTPRDGSFALAGHVRSQRLHLHT